jgi:hypothetical protein
MSRCGRWKLEISRFLDHDLDEVERRRLLDHMGVCAECRAVYRAYVEMSGSLRRAVVDACISGIGAENRTTPPLREPETAREGGRRSLPITRPRVFAVAASVLFVLFAATFLFFSSNRKGESLFSFASELDSPLGRYFYYVDKRFSDSTLTGVNEPMGAYFAITVAYPSSPWGDTLSP